MDDEENSWPGPFSTAWSIMQKREAAKQARDEKVKLAQQSDGNNLILTEDEELGMDEYDRQLQTVSAQLAEQMLSSTSLAVDEVAYSTVITLNALCVRAVAGHLHSGQFDLDLLTVEQRAMLLVELAKLGKINNTVAQQVASRYATVYVLPDCSQVDEDALLHALQTMLTSSSSGQQELELYQISLKHCGRCFSDRIASALFATLTSSEEEQPKARRGKRKAEDVDEDAILPGKQLEVLELIGCYKLSDDKLSLLLSAVQDHLYKLNVSYNNRISGTALQGIRRLLHKLQVLVLDHNTQLMDEDMLHLVQPQCLPCLQELSLAGLTNLTDKAVVAIISCYGHQLTAITLDGCVGLSGESIVAIRTHCGRLQMLSVSGIGEVDTATWLGLFLIDYQLAEQATMNTDEAEGYWVEESCSSSDPAPCKPSFDATSCLGQLKEVNVSNNPNITDDIITVLCENYSRTLTCLSVSSCAQLTNRSICAIYHRDVQLSRLDMCYVRSISADVLTLCILRCHHLQTVSMWGDSQLYNSNFRVLASNQSIGLLWENEVIKKRNVQFLGRPKL